MSDSLAADLETHLAMSDDEDPAQLRRSTRGRKRTQACICIQGLGTHVL